MNTAPTGKTPGGEARLVWFGVAAAVSGAVILAVCGIFTAWLVLTGLS